MVPTVSGSCRNRTGEDAAPSEELGPICEVSKARREGRGRRDSGWLGWQVATVGPSASTASSRSDGPPAAAANRLSGASFWGQCQEQHRRRRSCLFRGRSGLWLALLSFKTELIVAAAASALAIKFRFHPVLLAVKWTYLRLRPSVRPSGPFSDPRADMLNSSRGNFFMQRP